MNPILYESDETNFITNGLGRLPDCVSCKVTEARNGEYELQLKYPVTGRHFADITDDRIISAIPADGKEPQPFVIYRHSKPMNGIVTFYAQHISYRLNYIPVRPFRATNAADAMQCLSQYAAVTCPFTFWTDRVVNATCAHDVPGSIRSRLGGTEGSMLDCYGGELEWDKWTVKLHTARGTNKGVKIRYGKNLIDLLQDHNLSNVVTAVYPYWSRDGVYKELPERVVSTAHEFSWSRVEVVDITEDYETEPSEATMRSWATNYLSGKQTPKDSIKFSFVALWQTKEYEQIAPLERVNLCDTVTISYEPLGVETTAKVIRTVYDVLKERYESIEVGQGRTNLAATIIETSHEPEKMISAAKSWFDAAISHATDMIRGGLGGHVVMNADANGNPQEIIVMDRPDVDLAVNCIRINKNGIGFSQNGYRGPFNSAWLIDGTFDAQQINVINLNANSITAGTMSADRIKGGTLTVGGTRNGMIDVRDAHDDIYLTIDKYGVEQIDGYWLMQEDALGTGKFIRHESGQVKMGTGGSTYVTIDGSGTVTPITGNTYKGLKISTGAVELAANEIAVKRGNNEYVAQTTDLLMLVRDTVGGRTQDTWHTLSFVNGILVDY